MAKGPANPARLPIELITAIPAAAAAPERNAVGSVQNTGKQAKMPKPARQSDIIFNVGSSRAVDTAMPAAAKNGGKAVWTGPPAIRSDRRPHHTIPMTPTT